MTLNFLSFNIVKGPGIISVKDDHIFIKNWDIQFGPEKPLDISIEVDAKEEDEGKPFVVTKVSLGRWITDEGEPRWIKCGE